MTERAAAPSPLYYIDGNEVYQAGVVQAAIETARSEIVPTPDGGRDHAFLTKRLMKASTEVGDPSLGGDMRLAATVIETYDREFNEARRCVVATPK